MAKAKRQMMEMLPLLDVVVEVADARIPQSSRNPDLDRMIAKKPRVLVLTKTDMADPEGIKRWLEYYKAMNVRVVPMNSRTGEGLTELRKALKDAFSLENLKIRRTTRRVGVVGIPNAGKSTVLNRLVGRAAAQAGDRPGVTKGKQWAKMGEWEVLDTPGILWPRFDDQQAALLLAFTGGIRHEILNEEELALELIDFLNARYPGHLAGVFSVDLSEGQDAHDFLRIVGQRRGCLQKGGGIDELKAAQRLWSEFRSGKLGRFTLEDPPPATSNR